MMKKPYIIMDAAKADIQNIFKYISLDNQTAARRLLKIFIQAFENLSRNPDMGSTRKTLTKKKIRFWTVKKHYVVIYQPASKPLKILRIITSWQDINTILKK